MLGEVACSAMTFEVLSMATVPFVAIYGKDHRPSICIVQVGKHGVYRMRGGCLGEIEGPTGGVFMRWALSEEADKFVRKSFRGRRNFTDRIQFCIN